MPAATDQLPPLLDEARLKRFMLTWRAECGQRLVARRRQFGWSQKQLAELVGIRETSISRFEMGLQAPRDSVRVALACALNCEVADIWPAIPTREAMLVARHVEAA